VWSVRRRPSCQASGRLVLVDWEEVPREAVFAMKARIL